MLCVAYDAMTRRSELIAIDLEDLKFLGDGTGRLLIRRSKTDQAGEGHIAYLSRQTVRYLQAWLKRAGITEGAVFRRIIGRGTVTYNREGEGKIGGGLVPRRSPVRSKPSRSSSRCPRTKLGTLVATRYAWGRRKICWR